MFSRCFHNNYPYRSNPDTSIYDLDSSIYDLDSSIYDLDISIYFTSMIVSFGTANGTTMTIKCSGFIDNYISFFKF